MIMKYTEIELQYEDIMWFGVDRNGVVFECTSGGIGCVPLFVINSKEETVALQTFFFESLRDSSTETLYVPDKDSPLIQDCKILSRKGLYCFDVAIDDEQPDLYKKVSAPSTALTLFDLPSDIKSLMEKHIVDVNVEANTYISVPHGK